MVELRPINQDNWYACTQLEVSDKQKAFFPVPTVYWLAESAGWIPLSLYSEGELIGFSVYAIDPDDGSYWIMAFMIDQKHQNKGFGRVGMEALIRLIKTEHNCDKIILGHRIENERVANLYASLGFNKVDRNEHEVIRQLVFSKQ